MVREINKFERQRFCLCGSLIGYFPEDMKKEYTEWVPGIFNPEDYRNYEIRYNQDYIICPVCGTKMIINSTQEVRSV